MAKCEEALVISARLSSSSFQLNCFSFAIQANGARERRKDICESQTYE